MTHVYKKMATSVAIVAVVAYALFISFTLFSAQPVSGDSHTSSADISSSLREAGVAFTELKDQQLNASVSPLSYDESNRKLSTYLSLANGYSFFLDTLTYNVELYTGNALKTEGDIFAGLELVKVYSGPVDEIGPGEQRVQEVTMTVPETVPSGNYFIRVVVVDNQYNVNGLTYSSNPVEISGTGELLPVQQAYVRLDGENYGLFEGLLVAPDEVPTLIFPLNENPDLQAFVAAGHTLYAQGDVTHADDTSTPLRPIERTALVQSGSDLILSLDELPPFDPGTYSLQISFSNEEDRLVLDTYTLRWFVEGFFARIQNIVSQKNVYESGAPIDLAVSLVSTNEADVPVWIEATFTTVDGDEVTFSENGLLSPSTGGSLVAFSGHSFDKKTQVASVEVMVTNQADGSLLDAETYEFSQNVEIGNEGYSTQFTFVAVIALVVLLVLVLLLRTLIHKKAPPTPIAIIVCAVALSGGLVTSVYGLSAAPAVPQIIDGPEGEIGQCDQTVVVEYKSTATCAHCINGLSNIVKLQVSRDDGQTWNEQGFIANRAGNIANGSVGDESSIIRRGNGHVNSYVVGPVISQFDLTQEQPEAKYRVAAKTVLNGHNMNRTRIFGSCEPDDNRFWRTFAEGDAIEHSADFLHYTETRTVSCNADECLNVDGVQTTVPDGMYQTEGKQCYQGIQANCSFSQGGSQVSSATLITGQPITVSANIQGGDGDVDSIAWSGDVVGNTETVTKTFSTAGRYVAVLTVTENGEQLPATQCPFTVKADAFRVSCAASPLEPEPGETVIWAVRDVVKTGGPYTFTWTGAVSGSEPSLIGRYDTEGSYTANLTVTNGSGVQVKTACTVNVRDGGDPTTGDPSTGEPGTPGPGTTGPGRTTTGTPGTNDMGVPNGAPGTIYEGEAIGGPIETGGPIEIRDLRIREI